MHAFHAAVEAGDTDAIEALLAEDVVFTSPAVFKPYTGKAITAAILRGVVRVFEDFEYVREINDAGGRDHALVFTARVGDKQVTGCDFLSVNEDGLIDDFMVMVRPLSGLQALAEAMGAQFDQILADAEAGLA